MADIKYDRWDLRKTWVKRFMQKWSSSRTTITTHEADNSADVVTKVGQKKASDSTKSSSISGPISGTKNGPRIGAKATVCT